MDRRVYGSIHDSGRNGSDQATVIERSKNFASLYALFSGLIFIAIMGNLLTPVAHRGMHTFHIEKADED